MVWSISYVAVAPLRLVVVRLTGLFRTLNVPLHFLICVLRGSPQHYFVLRPTRLFSAYIAVTYGALSSTAIFVTYGALSSTCADCACLIGLFQACSVCVTSGALSGTNASTTGLQNLMEATLGHEQPLARGTRQTSYPPF